MFEKKETPDEIRFILNEVFGGVKIEADSPCFQSGGNGKAFPLKNGAETLKKLEKSLQETAPAIIQKEGKSPSAQTRLIELKARLDGYRALFYHTAAQLEMSQNAEEDVVKGFAQEYVALLAPIINGFAENPHSKEKGDFGLAFLAQAMDPKDLGFKLGLFMNPMAEEIAAAKKDDVLAPHAEKLDQAMKVFQGVAMNMIQMGMTGKTREVPYQAGDFARIFGAMAIGRMWLQMMGAAKQKLDDGATGEQADFYKAKLATGEYYLSKVMMPDIKRSEMRIDAGAATFGKITPAQLAPAQDSGVAKTPAGNDNKRKGFGLSF